MPSKSTWGDASKKQVKKNEFKHWKRGSSARQRKIKIKNKNEKEITARIRSDPLGWEDPAPWVCFGNLGLATTLTRVRHIVSVQTGVAGKIKSIPKGNSILTNLEELDWENSTRNLLGESSASFHLIEGIRWKEPLCRPSQLHYHYHGGNFGRASRQRGAYPLISGSQSIHHEPIITQSQLLYDVFNINYRRVCSHRR